MGWGLEHADGGTAHNQLPSRGGAVNPNPSPSLNPSLSPNAIGMAPDRWRLSIRAAVLADAGDWTTLANVLAALPVAAILGGDPGGVAEASHWWAMIYAATGGRITAAASLRAGFEV
jgi:hypothetical protein